MPGSGTPLVSAAFWPYLLKYGQDGTFLGYTVIRCQNGALAAVNQFPSSLTADSSGNIFWAGTVASNIFCNVNSISTTEPVSNIYSLNRSVAASTVITGSAQSNAFVIQFGPDGTVNKFTEWGASGSYARSVALSSTGGIYVSGQGVASSSYIPNFGLQNPGGTSPTYLTQSGITFTSGRSTVLLYYNSSGIVQGISQHPTATPGAITIDKNNYIYQLLFSINSSILLYNIGNTSSGLTIPATGQAKNIHIVKFNPSGVVVGYTTIPNGQILYSTGLHSDTNFVYLTNIFQNPGGVSNVGSISSTPVLYAQLPTSSGRSSAIIVKWAL